MRVRQTRAKSAQSIGTVAHGWRLRAGGWRLAAGGWRLAAGGWRLAENAVSFAGAQYRPP
jgi:hypothetical protein